MLENDSAYYIRRAEAELELAQRATKLEVCKAHFTLAEAYLARVFSDDRTAVAEQA